MQRMTACAAAPITVRRSERSRRLHRLTRKFHEAVSEFVCFSWKPFFFDFFNSLLDRLLYAFPVAYAEARLPVASAAASKRPRRSGFTAPEPRIEGLEGSTFCFFCFFSSATLRCLSFWHGAACAREVLIAPGRGHTHTHTTKSICFEGELNESGLCIPTGSVLFAPPPPQRPAREAHL